ncbi:MAG: hypothetical protein SynsKO_15040 [Synoicihabitans sp.]
MSLEEMENAWERQKTDAPESTIINKSVGKMTADFRRNMILCAGMTLVVVLAFFLKIHKIAIDPDRTFSNSIWELTISGMGIACMLFSVTYVIRFHRELQAIGQDTRRCLRLLIRNVEEEIRSIRRDAPSMFLIYLILFALAKWESIRAGLEQSGEWAFVITIFGMFAIFGAVLYHRMKVFLIPRCTELRALLKEFDSDA